MRYSKTDTRQKYSSTDEVLNNPGPNFDEFIILQMALVRYLEKIPFENGAWPAFWLTAATGTWGTTNGEIDLYESVNGENKGVHTTMHTPPHCIMHASVGGKSS